MRHLVRSSLVVAFLTTMSLRAAEAQRQTDAVAGVRHSEVVLLEAVAPLATKRPPAMGPYVVVGGLIGAAATIGAIWISLARSDTECICGPAVFAPVVAGGAVLGGVVGLIVYGVRSTRGRASASAVGPETPD